jgi:hypothetical protein
MRRAMMILGLGLVAAGPATAQTKPVSAYDAPEGAADKQEKLICKRFTETGSLVKGYRTCKSKREWERERDNIRAPRVTSGSCGGSAAGGGC